MADNKGNDFEDAEEPDVIMEEELEEELDYVKDVQDEEVEEEEEFRISFNIQAWFQLKHVCVDIHA